MLGVILQVEELRLAQQLRHARFLEQLLEFLVAGEPAIGAQKSKTGFTLHIRGGLAVAGFLGPVPFA